MHKIKFFTIAITLFVAGCLFAGCKKDVGSDNSGPTSVNSTLNLTAGNGQTITIKGSNLLAGGQAPVVTLNSRKWSLVSSSNDSVRAIVPKLAGTGKITLTIGGKSFDGLTLLINTMSSLVR